MARINDKLILDAENALNNPSVGIFSNSAQKTIPSVYNGYIAAFGASIIQSGFLPAMAFYQNKNSEEGKKRSQVIHAIGIMLGMRDGDELYEKCLRLQNDATGLQSLKKQVIESAIALKLVIRTYPLV